MYRHERTLLLDFIFVSVLVIGTIYALLQNSWLAFGIWLAMSIIRLVILVLHQIKWRLIYAEEAEQLKQNNKEE